MALDLNAIDWLGHNNKKGRQLQPKKIKVMLHQLFIYTGKSFKPPYITNKMEHISLKVLGVSHRW